MQCASPPLPSAVEASRVTTVVFYGTHLPLDNTDARLIAHHAADLRSAPEVAAEVWLLLLHELQSRGLGGSSLTALSTAATAVSRTVGAGVCVWRVEQLQAHFPGLAAGLEASAAYANETDYHMKRYYWLHASLALWRARVGRRYPSARYFWRIEPDVTLIASDCC